MKTPLNLDLRISECSSNSSNKEGRVWKSSLFKEAVLSESLLLEASS